MVLVDRRAEYADSLWRLDSSDRRNAYVLVVKRQGKLINPMPDNIMVYRYATEAECATAVFEHNKQVRDNAAKKT